MWCLLRTNNIRSYELENNLYKAVVKCVLNRVLQCLTTTPKLKLDKFEKYKSLQKLDIRAKFVYRLKTKTEIKRLLLKTTPETNPKSSFKRTTLGCSNSFCSLKQFEKMFLETKGRFTKM